MSIVNQYDEFPCLLDDIGTKTYKVLLTGAKRRE